VRSQEAAATLLAKPAGLTLGEQTDALAGPSVEDNYDQEGLRWPSTTRCVEREYPAGTAFVDLGHGDVHTAFNATDDVTVLVATFFEPPQAGPLLIPAETPADCAV
jgi:hypothetical protein